MTNPWTDHQYGAAPTRLHYDYDSFGSGRELLDQSSTSSVSLARYAPLFCLQLVTSLMSVCASTVVVRIACAKLDKAYQRIIFVLNIALVLDSIFLALHPLLVDSNGDGAYWAVGNSATCNTVGFFLTFGSLMVSMYHTTVALYFCVDVQMLLKSYKRRGSRERDTESRSSEASLMDKYLPYTEIMINMVCLFLPVGIAGTAASWDAFGYDPSVGVCTFYGSSGASYGDTAWLVIQNVFRWTLVASGATTILVTLIIQFRVLLFQKRTRNGDDDCANTSDNNKSPSNGGSSSSMTDSGTVVDKEARQIIGQKLQNFSTQSLFYAISYSSSYVWFIAQAFLPKSDGTDKKSNWMYTFQLMAVIFYPLLGVFNCVIYVRPRVQWLRVMYPQDSFFVAIRVAASKAGGPEEIEEVRAKIYGSNYSRSGDDKKSLEIYDPRRGNVDNDTEAAKDREFPSIVSFDPSSAISVESWGTHGEDKDPLGTHGEDKDHAEHVPQDEDPEK